MITSTFSCCPLFLFFYGTAPVYSSGTVVTTNEAGQVLWASKTTASWNPALESQKRHAQRRGRREEGSEASAPAQAREGALDIQRQVWFCAISTHVVCFPSALTATLSTVCSALASSPR